ncbi:MAG: PilZ domain-containing protein [Candidatus Omnitrophica bacterium]|nr:PilZ domain-containing protein [Candidatus Omnitrophota bacterium]
MVTTNFTRNEQRLFQRFDASFPARLQGSDSDFGSFIRLTDASAQGIKIRTTAPLNLNDAITLEIKLPYSDNPMLLKAEVVWANHVQGSQWEIGLRCPKINLFRMSRLYDQFPVKENPEFDR